MIDKSADRDLIFFAANLPHYARKLALLNRLLDDGGRARRWGPYMITHPTRYVGSIYNRGKLVIFCNYIDDGSSTPF